jgi:hypothetical protein
MRPLKSEICPCTGEGDDDHAHHLEPWELWACALTVERQYDTAADAHVADRLTALANAGDWAGVATWRAIAACLDKLKCRGMAH